MLSHPTCGECFASEANRAAIDHFASAIALLAMYAHTTHTTQVRLPLFIEPAGDVAPADTLLQEYNKRSLEIVAWSFVRLSQRRDRSVANCASLGYCVFLPLNTNLQDAT